jgi:hypothetical protein
MTVPWLSKRDYQRFFAVAILIAFVIAHSLFPSRFGLDWPSVALLATALCLFLLPRFLPFLPLLKTFKIGKAEFELREQTNALAISVDKSEESGLQLEPSKEPEPAQIREKRLVNTSTEAHIIDLAAKDKQAALMRLAIEIEKEVLLLHGVLGLRNQSKGGTFRNFVEELKQHGAITDDIKEGLMEFWRVRNQIAHSQYSNNSILASALDSGLRLLRLLKAIPRPTYTVINPKVTLFKDGECRDRIDEYHGVILEITDQQGTKRRMIFPAGREFEAGEVVGWDWDFSRKFGLAYFRDPESGQCTTAWSSSLAFVGKSAGSLVLDNI